MKKTDSRIIKMKYAVVVVLTLGYFFGEPIPHDIDAKWVLKPVLTMRNLATSVVSPP